VRTLHKMFGKSMLASICIVGALIIALFPAAVVGAGSSESGFHISQRTGETWEEIYQHQFRVQYSTEAFTVDVVDGKVALRIVQVGTPFADVDQISLMVDGEELTPEYARYTGSGESILDDILELDNNVVIAHEQEIEISWDVPAGNDSVTVYLTANEYGHSLPFHFPETGYATYTMGSNTGSITVDGLITETDGTVPLYAPYWQPSTGHPDGYTYIYVCDDEEYVYFSLDVTGDNTNEYGEDWAEIRILQPEGSEQAFRIDDYDNTWGMSGFGLTSKVSYKHQTYEFAIPKIIIGNENIAFNLAYYGTLGAPYVIDTSPDLDIEINGDPSEGQVFGVGDNLSIDGYITSSAGIQDAVNATASLSAELFVEGPGLSDSAYYLDSDYGSGYLYVGAISQNISLSYELEETGWHTITLSLEARVQGDINPPQIIDVSQFDEITLDFYVGSALTINDVTVDEDAGYATFTVSLSSPSESTVTVDYSTSDGTATAGSDYTAVTSNLTFDPGELTQTIDIEIIDDELSEFKETFYVNLTNATNAEVGDDTGLGTIIDDEPTLGRLFMVNGYYDYDDGEPSSEILELNPSTGAIVRSIPTPVDTDGGGDGLAYGNGRMFFATISTDTIYEIDPLDGDQINSFLGPETWDGIDALGFSGDELYVLDYDASIIYILDPDSGTTVGNLTPGVSISGGGTFAGTRNSLFFTGYDSEGAVIYEIDAETGDVENTFLPPAGSHSLYGLGFSSSRNTLFVGSYDGNIIWEVDPDDGSVINSFSGPEGAAISALAADEPLSSNDNFADAAVITGASGSTTGTNAEATIEDGEPFHSQYSDSTKTVWWSWTAPTTGTAAFDTLGSDFDTVMAAYTGSNVSSLTLLSENDDAYYGNAQSRIVFKVTPTATYHIAVAGYWDGATGDITLNWGYATPPANDDFPGITISGTSGSSVFSSVNATREEGEPLHVPVSDDPDYAGRSSLWWSWTAPSSGNVTFDTNGSVRDGTTEPIDVVLAIYTGTSLGSLTSINYSDSYPYDEVVLSAVEATTYRIAVDGYGTHYTEMGYVHLNWNYPAPIFTSATGTAFVVGTAGLFDITTTADPVASSISLISGTLPTGVNFTNNGDGTATLSGTPAAGTGNAYSLTFSANNTLATGTQNFTLTVNEAPAFVSASSTNFTVGTYGVFNLATTGYPPVASINLTSGSLPLGIIYDNNAMTLSGTPAAGTGGTHPLTFSASNGISPDASQNFTLTVNEAPIFTSGDNDTFALNSTGSFTVTASGYPAPSIHLTSGTPPSGVAYNSSTGILSGTPTEGGTFTLTFTASNGVSPNATQNFTLNVNAAPNITTPPQNVVVEEGQNASFTVIYNAYPAPTFQWQISRNGGGRWSNIKGANSATYDISATTSRMSGNLYRVIISNNLGTTTSDPATLTVMPGPYTTADVSIDKTDGVYDSLNGTISWDISVTNSGPGTAEGVTVADNLARGTRFSSITGISQTNVKVKGSSVTVAIGSLTDGASVNFTVVVQVTRATSPVDNTVIATVSTASHDPDLSNNTDSAVCSW
jgi:hypothetical protein